MICEKVFRSRAGKTVILRVYDLRLIEDSLSKGKRPNAFILGVDIDELYEKFLECVKK